MKNIKRILAIVFCSIICFSLCSCNYIDELRSKQAFYDESGNITFRDEVYITLPSCENLKYYTEGYGRVTTEDVPVLLSDNYGQSFSFNKDLSLLRISQASCMLSCVGLSIFVSKIMPPRFSAFQPGLL